MKTIEEYRNLTDKYIEDNRDNIIEDIRNLVAFKSETCDFKTTVQSLEYVLNRAEQMGLRTKIGRNKTYGICETGDGDETVAVLVHVDVVNIGDIEKWTFDPFTLTEKDGYLYGRGIVDDKGPVIMGLYALKALKDLDIPIDKKVQLVIGTSEEETWVDMLDCAMENNPPTYGFTPDGDFPLYNSGKGYADAVLSFKEENISLIKSLTGGASTNAIPSKAVIVYTDDESKEYDGIACHSSSPELGKNAIYELAKGEKDRDFNFIRFINDFLTDDWFSSKLEIDDESVQGGTEVRTTCVPTVISIEDGCVRLNINLRTSMKTKDSAFKEAFERYKDEYSYDISYGNVISSVYVPEDRPYVKEMAEVYESYGLKNEFKTAAGTSYAAAVPECVCWGPVFPDEPSCAHMEDERINIGKMILAAQMYAAYLAYTAGK